MAGERFVFEPIVVDVNSISPLAAAEGAPGCPMRFVWRGQTYHVVRVLGTEKQTRAHDSQERYVRSHAFRVLTDAGLEMVLRCNRQVRGNPWRLYTVREATDPNGE